MCAHLGLEDDVRVARVELTLVGLVRFLLLDHSKLLDAPDLKANLLADTLEAGVEDSGHAGGGLEAWAQSTVSDQTVKVAISTDLLMARGGGGGTTQDQHRG